MAFHLGLALYSTPPYPPSIIITISGSGRRAGGLDIFSEYLLFLCHVMMTQAEETGNHGDATGSGSAQGS